MGDTLTYFGINFFNITKDGFLIGLPALFSIVSPVGGALIFYGLTEGSTVKERYALGWRVALYSGITMLASLLLGAAILSFFGIGVSALRIAGGLLVASAGWQSLNSAQTYEQRALAQPNEKSTKPDHAFFPLTMPLTTGPGTISVCIALSSSKGSRYEEIVPYLFGLSLAACIIAVMVGICYSSAQRIVAKLGEQRNAVLIRLLAFILLCIGVQIFLTGISDFYNTQLHGAVH